jgi:hypothetical protein
MTWLSSPGGVASLVFSSAAGDELIIGSDGICSGSSSAGGEEELIGSAGFGGSLCALSAEAMSSLLATIVLYGSAGVSSATSGVPSVWQNRRLSSNVFWQVGQRFIANSSNVKS